MSSPDSSSWKLKLEIQIHSKFTSKYGTSANDIAQKLMQHFDDEEYGWEFIMQDLNEDKIEDCEAMTKVIQTELHDHLISAEQKQEAFKLYKSCVETEKNIIDDINIRIQENITRQVTDNVDDPIKDQISTQLKSFSTLEDIQKDIEMSEKQRNNSKLYKKIQLIDRKNRFNHADIRNMLRASLNPRDAVISPTQYPVYCDISEKHIETASILLKEHCGSIFKTEYPYKPDEKDDEKIGRKSYRNAKAIDIINEKPILLFFVDCYSRIRLRHYCHCKYSEKIPDNDNKYIDRWYLGDFFNENTQKTAQLFENIKRCNCNLVSIEQLQHGLKSFLGRFHICMKLSTPLRYICDNLNEYSTYARGVADYVINITNNNFITAKWIPLQVDIVIIPQCVKGLANIAMSYDQTLVEDDDDEDDIPDDHKEDLLLMGFGGIDSATNKPVNEINDIGAYLIECGYEKGIDYIEDEIPYLDDTAHHDDQCTGKTYKEFFGDLVIKRKLGEMHKEINNKYNKSHQRLIFVIDRRDPKVVNDDKSIHYALNGKQWNDKIYCIRPKEYNKIPKMYYFLPEALFCLSQELMLPSKGKRIGIRESLNGYMFVMSYHIYSKNTIRAYFGYNGQIQRFYLDDVISFWPNLFAKRSENTLQTVNDEFKKYAKERSFPDADFDAFLQFFEQNNT